MAMNPRLHRRGAPPDFTLPRPNPNPSRMTDALWWLVCMREALEPALSENGGTFANKPGYHNAGENLPNHGEGNAKTDHSIRRPPDRRGPWWRSKASAHDWTFLDAQRGQYGTISKYMNRRLKAMRDPLDLRPDNVFAYTLGQADGDLVVEGYNEYRDEAEASADKTHLWHIHDSFRRDIIGSHWAMWRALTIDMGWSYDDWLKSTQPVAPPPPPKPAPAPVEEDMQLSDKLWDPASPPAWAQAWVEAHPGTNPTVFNLLFHTGTTVDRLETRVAELAAELAEVKALLAEPEGGGTEAEAISRGGFNPGS